MVTAERVNLAFDDNGPREATEPTLLDRYFERIGEQLETDGLKSLRWVSGIHTREIAADLVMTLTKNSDQTEHAAGARHVLARRDEPELADLFGGRLGCEVRVAEDECEDSFLIINDTTVLDLTPMGSDGGRPEYLDDAVVANLYIELFEGLRAQSDPISVLQSQLPLQIGDFDLATS